MVSPMKHGICLPLVSLLFFPHIVAASDSVNRQEAVARLEQAVSKTNIFELPSFALEADVEIEEQGKFMKGTYELLWNGPDQWREGVRIPGYNEVQIGGKGTIWLERSTDFIPFMIYNLRQALGFGSTADLPQAMALVRLSLTSKDTITKTHQRKEHGDLLTCFEIENELKSSSETCVHDATGTIARSSSLFADGNLEPVGRKVFPRLLIYHRGHKLVAKVDVTELTSPAQFSPDTFTARPGVAAHAGCMNPLPPRLVNRQPPEYPSIARQQHHEGTVVFGALIGKDGALQLQRLLESAGSDLDDSSRRALSHWRYDPAVCNGQPVEVETVLQVNYTLSAN